jgi:hypothetical protein
MDDRLLFKMTLLILALPVVIAAGCNERYRYPCQDPKNWETAQCQKPLCEVHRQCPELIFKEDSASVGLKDDQISIKPVAPLAAPICNKGCDNGK